MKSPTAFFRKSYTLSLRYGEIVIRYICKFVRRRITLKVTLRRSLWTAVAVIVLFSTGCGNEPVTETEVVTGVEKTPYAAAVSMESTPIVDYAVPQLLPNVLVDQKGYDRTEEKVAIIRGNEVSDNFCLKDARTGEVVYSGLLEEVLYNEEQNLYAGYAEFSSFNRPGTYYVECDVWGQSYSFEITEDLYGILLAELYEELIESCAAGELSVARAMVLLQSYEWYGKVFPDADEDKIPDVMESLREWITYMEANGVEPSEEALYAAFLAKFSYLYQKMDYDYATDCLKRASTVFDQIQVTINKDADIFWALTEMYRATNLSKYRKQILEYKDFFADNSSYLEQQEYLYGSMTYLVTRHSVNKDLCEIFMNNVMSRGEEISGKYEDLVHPLAAKNNGSTDLLKRAIELSCANYVLNNYQYTNIIEEFLHYLMGRNPESVNFYESDEDKCGYLLLLAQLVANRE